VPPLIHFIPDLRTYSVPLFLKRQCDRTLGPARRRRPAARRPRPRQRRPPGQRLRDRSHHHSRRRARAHRPRVHADSGRWVVHGRGWAGEHRPAFRGGLRGRGPLRARARCRVVLCTAHSLHTRWTIIVVTSVSDAALHTRLADTFGASVSDAAPRPNPRPARCAMRTRSAWGSLSAPSATATRGRPQSTAPRSGRVVASHHRASIPWPPDCSKASAPLFLTRLGASAYHTPLRPNPRAARRTARTRSGRWSRRASPPRPAP
jgi:hypothetical protein